MKLHPAWRLNRCCLSINQKSDAKHRSCATKQSRRYHTKKVLSVTHNIKQTSQIRKRSVVPRQRRETNNKMATRRSKHTVKATELHESKKHDFEFGYLLVQQIRKSWLIENQISQHAACVL